MTSVTAIRPTTLPGFVSIQQDYLDQPALDSLIRRCMIGTAWYCLRWPNRTIFKAGFPNNLTCIEGQVFNRERELRWKRQGDRYEALLLSATTITDAALGPLEDEPQWLIRDLNAHFYPSTETKLPRGIDYPRDLNIGQRYFIHQATGIVQFVALRAIPHGE